MRRTLALFVLAALMAVSCSDDDGGSAGSEATGSGPAAPADEWTQRGGPVVMTRLPVLSDTVATIAVAEGYFEQFGLEVRFEDTRAPSQLLPAHINGQIDVLNTSFSRGTLDAITGGAQVVAVATGAVLAADGCAHLSMLALPTTLERISFDDPSTMRDVRIGAVLTNMTTVRYLEHAVRSWGLGMDEVEVIELERTALAPALAQGDIDLAVSLEPAATIMRRSAGAVVTNPAHQIVPDQVMSMITFGPRLLEDRELGARFLAGYLLAERQFREGPTDRNVEIVAPVTELEPDLLREMCWSTLDSHAAAYEDRVSEVLQWGVDRGELESVPDPSILWDHTFRARALELIAEAGIDLEGG